MGMGSTDEQFAAVAEMAGRLYCYDRIRDEVWPLWNAAQFNAGSIEERLSLESKVADKLAEIMGWEA